MQNIFIELLPPWVETGLQPAFYDKESGTVLQQVSRMYAKINQLIGSVNNQNKAINKQNKTITDYIQKFIDFKDYVETYLNNLDVQQEINNKLDQMSKSGELADIIAQYIKLAGLITFNVVDDMVNATNLNEGSNARTMGKITYNDGYGEFYHIRNITTSDNIDGNNIIALNNYPSLIAEKLPDAKFTDFKNNIEDEVNNKISNVQLSNLNDPSIKSIAHRGSSIDAPENTLPAYLIAKSKHFWGGECDINKTSDNHYVLIHDKDVSTSTNGSGNVNELTLQQVKELTINKGSNISFYNNLKIPTLEEYLNICYQINLVPVIELKTDTLNEADATNIADIVKNFGLIDKCIFISFSSSLITTIKQKYPKSTIQWVTNSLDNANIDYCKSIGAEINCIVNSVTKDLVNYAHSKDVKVNVWTITNNNQFMDLYYDNIHVDYVTSNSIDYLRNQKLPIFVDSNGYKAWNEHDKDVILNKGILVRSITPNEQDVGNINYVDIMNFENYPYGDTSAITAVNRLMSSNLITNVGINKVITFKSHPDLKLTLKIFDNNGMLLRDLGWLTSGYKFTDNCYYAIAYGKKVDNTQITDVDIHNFSKILNSIKIA